MRHFAVDILSKKIPLNYTVLDSPENIGNLAGQLIQDCQRLKPAQLKMVWPGEWDVLQSFQKAAEHLNIPLEIKEDTHFLITPDEFKQHMLGRKQLRMEFFYRKMRQRYQILMDENDKPEGGTWNFDQANQEAFSKSGPGIISLPHAFESDEITKEVIYLVEKNFPNHPGKLEHFDWPVTSEDAKLALYDFIQNRLRHFGKFQDAMWLDPLLPQPYLFHSRLSAVMNLKLIHPLEVIQAAEHSYRKGNVSLEDVEGFIRQILGWREYVRGIYWQFMPNYREENALNATMPLPEFYWTAETDMTCLKAALKQTLEYGYAHHIQRLMVTGLFALLLGVYPKQLHEWYLAVYVDAVEWVELPNTLGMSQYGDGGIIASKPYIASGKYIDRMSNYCKHCHYRPDEKTGETACPFTTLYWDFLIRHQESLSKNSRMGMQLRNLSRLGLIELERIKTQAHHIKQKYMTETTPVGRVLS
jgi:deoxyribodipyrimidine photolyase-related protein